MTAKLRQVEGDVAELGGERRESLRLMVAGQALFLFGARIPKEHTRREGGTTRVLRFVVWSPRGGRVWCEVRDALVDDVLRLAEGERVRIAGQLFVEETGTVPRRTWVTVRVYELESID